MRTKKSFFSFVTKNMATNNSRALVYGPQIIFDPVGHRNGVGVRRQKD